MPQGGAQVPVEQGCRAPSRPPTNRAHRKALIRFRREGGHERRGLRREEESIAPDEDLVSMIEDADAAGDRLAVDAHPDAVPDEEDRPAGHLDEADAFVVDPSHGLPLSGGLFSPDGTHEGALEEKVSDGDTHESRGVFAQSS